MLKKLIKSLTFCLLATFIASYSLPIKLFTPSPNYSGYVYKARWNGSEWVADLSNPAKQVWVKQNATADGMWRWAKTDNNGRYYFSSWTSYHSTNASDFPNIFPEAMPKTKYGVDCSACGGVDWQCKNIVQYAEYQTTIDADRDGINDSPKNSSACEGIYSECPLPDDSNCSTQTYQPANSYGCTTPMSISVQKPYNWNGEFSPISLPVSQGGGGNLADEVSQGNIIFIEYTPTPTLTPTATPTPQIGGSFYKGSAIQTGLPGSGDQCIALEPIPLLPTIRLSNSSVEVSRPGSTIMNNQSLNNDNSYYMDVESHCDGVTEDCYTITLTLPTPAPGDTSSLMCSCGKKPGDPFTCEYRDISGPKDDVHFFLKETNMSQTGWFQTYGGDILALEQVTSAINANLPFDTNCSTGLCTDALIINNPAGENYTAGFPITYGGEIEDEDRIHSSSYTNSPDDGMVEGFTLTAHNETYNKFGERLRDYVNGTFSTLDPIKPSAVPNNLRVYHYDNLSGITIDASNNNWDLNNNEKIVVFVKGNLNLIDSDPSDADNIAISVPTNKKAFIAFIVKGDVNIDAKLGYSDPTKDPLTNDANVQGVFIADGSINVLGYSDAPYNNDDEADLKFIGEGTFVGWTGINLTRDFDDNDVGIEDNLTNPAEVFMYRPEFVINAPNEFKYANFYRVETEAGL